MKLHAGENTEYFVVIIESRLLATLYNTVLLFGRKWSLKSQVFFLKNCVPFPSLCCYLLVFH